MKKLFINLIAAAALTLAACSSPMEDLTAAVNEINTECANAGFSDGVKISKAALEGKDLVIYYEVQEADALASMIDHFENDNQDLQTTFGDIIKGCGQLLADTDHGIKFIYFNDETSYTVSCTADNVKDLVK